MDGPGSLPELRAALTTTCRSLDGARTLPSAVFTQRRIHDLEQRKLFASHWLAVACVAEFEEAGSFVTKEVAGERILIVRDEAGALHAFFNVCRHRGARLVDEASGRLRSGIACPYHAWVYGFDGRLRRAPQMVIDADSDDLGLVTIPLVVREGFVFVQLDRQSTLEPALPDLKRFDLGALVRVAQLEYEVRCNWKIVCENYSECYHCPGVHPQLSRLSDLSGDGFEDEAGFNGGPMQLRPGIDTLSTSGRSDWQRLCDPWSNATSRIHYWLVYPNLMLGVHPDYLLVHRAWPIATDRCRVDCEVFVHRNTAARAGFDARPVVAFWDVTNRQDWALCERVQQGAASRGYRPGPYHSSERCVHAFDRWYARWLLNVLQGQD
jgi:Rieske 2Fe-2S family protein